MRPTPATAASTPIDGILSRDGVIAPSTLLHTNDTASNLPRPYLAAGANKNEWTVAWQDSDVPKGSPEIYAARILCR